MSAGLHPRTYPLKPDVVFPIVILVIDESYHASQSGITGQRIGMGTVNYIH